MWLAGKRFSVLLEMQQAEDPTRLQMSPDWSYAGHTACQHIAMITWTKMLRKPLVGRKYLTTLVIGSIPNALRRSPDWSASKGYVSRCAFLQYSKQESRQASAAKAKMAEIWLE